jgi:PAS domain S-box-containing protein
MTGSDTDKKTEVIDEFSGSTEAEEGLRATEEQLRTIADNVPQLIWTNLPNGQADYFNKRWYEFTGLSYEQSRGPGWQAVVHPEDAPASTKSWQEALSAGEVFDCEYRLRNAEGQYRWFIGRNVPLKDRQGRVLSWFGSATDIERLKEAEANVHQARERFELLVEGAKDYAMFMLDLDNRITYWSAGAERLFGWSRSEAEGKSGELIFTKEDRAKGAVEHEIGMAMREGCAPDRRWHKRQDGTRLWIDGVMTRLDDENGQPRALAKIARDATQQKENEEALIYARDQLEQRVMERTADLIATNRELRNTMAERERLERELLDISERERNRIGHELHDVLCQELTATALFLKSTSSKIKDAEAARSLNEAADIVNRNVAVARDLARGLQLDVVGTGGLIDALRALCKQTNEHPKIRCSLKVPKIVRIADEVLALTVYRVAQEAVRNAVVHADPTEIIICIEREPGLVRLVVEDDGKGFKPRKSGKGLGLSIMKYRAGALGGTLRIDPRPERGTKVTCEVPAQAAGRAKQKK